MRRQPTQRWSCRPSVGRCCGCARVRAAGAGDWPRLSEDTGDTLVKDTVIAGAGAGAQPQPRRGAKSRAKSGSKAARDEWTEEKKEEGRQKGGEGVQEVRSGGGSGS